MIKKGIFIILTLFLLTVNAQPLKVAVAIETPPFVYHAGTNLFYGFDISMMQYICNKIGRPCQFTSMPFKQIIPGVASGKYDAAVSSITITPERAKEVRFSIPYLPGYCQFMTTSNFSQSYSLLTLRDNKIGYVAGSLFPEILSSLGAAQSEVSFPDVRSMIQGLLLKDIQIIIDDEPTVSFWVNKGSGKFKTLGAPFKYGLGIAIAIRPDQPGLVDQINGALSEYLKSNAYNQNYQIFIHPSMDFYNKK